MNNFHQTKVAALLYKTINKAGSNDEALAMERFRHAHKFIFDGASIPSELFFGAGDYGDQLAQFSLLKLPYDVVVFQIGPIVDVDDTEIPWTYEFILAWHEGDDICGRYYSLTPRGCNSGRATYRIHQGLQWEEWIRAKASDWCAADTSPLKGNDDKCNLSDEEAMDLSGRIYASMLYCAIGCLAAEGIEQSETREPAWINQQRQKKGKAPIFGYRLVSVNVNLLRIPGVAGPDGSHAPPRLHWRRGHIRRKASGKLVMVRPCLVGDPTTKLVEKGYIVRSPGAALH